jgi:hypothetical protein
MQPVSWKRGGGTLRRRLIMDILTKDEGLQMVRGDLEIPDRLLGRE